MVREVTERLHELRPAIVVVLPAGVAVEFLIVFNERFDKSLLSFPWFISPNPHLRVVDHNWLVDDAGIIKLPQDVERLRNHASVIVEVTCLLHTNACT